MMRGITGSAPAKTKRCRAWHSAGCHAAGGAPLRIRIEPGAGRRPIRTHTAGPVRGGFSKGTIVAIAQTQDGYLWLGTEFGLFRFDGVQQVQWQPPAGQQLQSSYIRTLLAARDGRLWIGTNQGLASWK